MEVEEAGTMVQTAQTEVLAHIKVRQLDTLGGLLTSFAGAAKWKYHQRQLWSPVQWLVQQLWGGDAAFLPALVPPGEDRQPAGAGGRPEQGGHATQHQGGQAQLPAGQGAIHPASHPTICWNICCTVGPTILSFNH